MAEIFYAAPKPGAGGVNLRSQPFVDSVTLVGLALEGVRLELDRTGPDWHACRVYVSTLVAQELNGFVTLRPDQFQINIRLAPQIADLTDIGDLNAGQQLELISSTADWLVARVYMSAAFTDIITDQQAGPTPAPTPTPTRFPNTTLTNAVELANTPLAPAQKRALPPGFTQNHVSAVNVWNKYGGVIELLAGRVGIDIGVAVAVVAVESGGRGFAPDGRLLIRLENHIFWSQWGKDHPDAFNSLFAFGSAQPWQGHKYRLSAMSPWKDAHTSQAAEWEAFGVARSLDDRSAKLSISMGLGQVMGFNFSTIGYASVEAMFDALSSDERFHVLSMFSFIQRNNGLVQALQRNNLAEFARGYNGPGQMDFYAGLIGGVRDAFNSLTPSRAAVRAAAIAPKRRGRPPKGQSSVPVTSNALPTLEPVPSDAPQPAVSQSAARSPWVEPADISEPKLRLKRRKRQIEPAEKVVAKRGRPAKSAKPATVTPATTGKRGRGRPRKVPLDASPITAIETPVTTSDVADTSAPTPITSASES